jgi:hypothetical protein
MSGFGGGFGANNRPGFGAPSTGFGGLGGTSPLGGFGEWITTCRRAYRDRKHGAWPVSIIRTSAPVCDAGVIVIC